MVHRIYPAKLQLSANASDTEAAFLDLNLPIYYGTASTKLYDKQDDFNFGIANFPFLDGDVTRRPTYGVYISHPSGKHIPLCGILRFFFLSRLVVSLIMSIIAL